MIFSVSRFLDFEDGEILSSFEEENEFVVVADEGSSKLVVAQN